MNSSEDRHCAFPLNNRARPMFWYTIVAFPSSMIRSRTSTFPRARVLARSRRRKGPIWSHNSARDMLDNGSVDERPRVDVFQVVVISGLKGFDILRCCITAMCFRFPMPDVLAARTTFLLGTHSHPSHRSCPT
ncbi:hypothetical protein MSAN_01250900 [Mycena sanguinolenta]|uniref:Uncharacterized protein n=1 Tax=Mycena sanguinolenta TaxID=230812 RepID=A0A8H7D530_9AGAR|nr:hypothetical protein MSAN_01250900 [Mycena sanguinolenta]